MLNGQSDRRRIGAFLVIRTFCNHYLLKASNVLNLRHEPIEFSHDFTILAVRCCLHSAHFPVGLHLAPRPVQGSLPRSATVPRRSDHPIGPRVDGHSGPPFRVALSASLQHETGSVASQCHPVLRCVLGPCLVVYNASSRCQIPNGLCHNIPVFRDIVHRGAFSRGLTIDRTRESRQRLVFSIARGFWMQSKQLLVTALNLSASLVMPLLEDLRSAPLVAPTPAGGNHAHWILGHLVQSEGQFRSMMRQIPNPVDHLSFIFGGGSVPDSTGANYPAYAELLATLVDMRSETMQWLESISETDLDQASQNVPPGFEPFFGTWRQCLLMQAMHWMNHRGQLADCRRAAGRERLMA